MALILDCAGMNYRYIH